MDRFINNRAPRRLVLIFIIMLALSAAAAYIVSGKCADIIVAAQIESELSAVGGGSFTGAPDESAVSNGEEMLRKYSIREKMPPELMYSYPHVRHITFSALFGLMTAVSALWLIISIREVMSVFRDLEKLRDDCIEAAYDTHAAIKMYGEELGTVHRVCESAEILVERMRNTSSRLTNEQEFLRTFLTDLSHQIKTSLAVVRLNTDMLSELDELSEERREKLTDEIQLNLDGMERLVIEAIKLAKLNANAVEYQMQPYSVSELFGNAVKKLSPLLRQKDIVINTSLPDDIRLTCDKGWLCEAIENILKNSADHSECTEISAELTQNPVLTTLVITDNGKGIPQDEIPKLFDRFSSKSQDRTMYSSGLGMSIAQKIVRANNGEIFVYSAPGKGTRFEFVFLAMSKNRM
jgi:signal transduction histidine kinase